MSELVSNPTLIPVASERCLIISRRLNSYPTINRRCCRLSYLSRLLNSRFPPNFQFTKKEWKLRLVKHHIFVCLASGPSPIAFSRRDTDGLLHWLALQHPVPQRPASFSLGDRAPAAHSSTGRRPYLDSNVEGETGLDLSIGPKTILDTAGPSQTFLPHLSRPLALSPFNAAFVAPIGATPVVAPVGPAVANTATLNMDPLLLLSPNGAEEFQWANQPIRFESLHEEAAPEADDVLAQPLPTATANVGGFELAAIPDPPRGIKSNSSGKAVEEVAVDLTAALGHWANPPGTHDAQPAWQADGSVAGPGPSSYRRQANTIPANNPVPSGSFDIGSLFEQRRVNDYTGRPASAQLPPAPQFGSRAWGPAAFEAPSQTFVRGPMTAGPSAQGPPAMFGGLNATIPPPPLASAFNQLAANEGAMSVSAGGYAIPAPINGGAFEQSELHDPVLEALDLAGYVKGLVDPNMLRYFPHYTNYSRERRS
ncbi:hypothetical protein FRB90_001142 [Tulasnella sp. 427]|nr:hypothetical protein FRB90_001142 [Tulasnella sp. 427]